MTRVCVVCEGQTEVRFVSECLEPYLRKKVSVFPTLIQAPSKRHRGGRVSVERLVRFVSHQYRLTDRITTLVDFYGFENADGRNRAQLESDIAAGVASKVTHNYNPSFFLPYVQMYEFEGLLFTDPSAFEWVIDGWNDNTRSALEAVSSAFDTPEEINDSRETAPSKRIHRIFPAGTYSKVEHGPLITDSIGLDAIRAKCPAFNEWVTQLEAWGG